MINSARKPLLLSALVLGLSATLSAEVIRVEVKTRADIGASGYEKIVGIAHFAIDPKDPHNRVITDLDKAPVNAAGRVEFSADLYILRPKDAARSNDIALIDVVNRGRKRILDIFNRGGAMDPATDADLGDGFLMRQGFTLVWVGWQFDVRRQGGSMGISLPSAQGINDIVNGLFTPDTADERQTFGDLAGYTPSDPVSPENQLVVRDNMFATPQIINRARWTLEGNTVTLQGGFQPGRIYSLSYRANNLPIAGLGLAAFRDASTWVKHAPDSLARTRYTLAFGSSQSGRFLRTFLYQGFNTDEKGTQVFDAVWAHIAGAARLSLNERGATPTSLSMYKATAFPYANQATRDPLTGRTEGLLDNDRARVNQPKTFYTNTSVEYWGGGRSAALVHTSPDGTTDLALPDNTRVYFLTGAQHSPAAFPPRTNEGQQPDNSLAYVWTMRALLDGMGRWLREGAAPPASQYPRIADGTLTAASSLVFPAIPGVPSPRIVQGARLFGYESASAGRPIAFVVPQVDADGNERAGVRTAELLMPMATYTGWNFRKPSIGGTDQLVSLLGSRIPLARTKAEREAARDPRPSVAERYASRESYIARAKELADGLVKGGYLLSQDVPDVMKRIEEQWGPASAGP